MRNLSEWLEFSVTYENFFVHYVKGYFFPEILANRCGCPKSFKAVKKKVKLSFFDWHLWIPKRIAIKRKMHGTSFFLCMFAFFLEHFCPKAIWKKAFIFWESWIVALHSPLWWKPIPKSLTIMVLLHKRPFFFPTLTLQWNLRAPIDSNLLQLQLSLSHYLKITVNGSPFSKQILQKIEKCTWQKLWKATLFHFLFEESTITTVDVIDLIFKKK